MTGSRQRPLDGNGHPKMKMKELVEATGVAKSTILLYVKKGLLPRPTKTSPNMAYYDSICVERLAFIKGVQTRHRLPLAAIKGLIKAMEKGRDVAPLIELQSYIFGSGKHCVDKTAFVEKTGLTRVQVDNLCSRRILIPREDGLFDEEDQAVGKLLSFAVKLGIKIETLSFYPKLAEQMVDHEIQLRKQHTEGLGFEKDAALTLEMTRMARALRAYVIDRIMQGRLIEFKGLKNHTEK